MYKDTRGFIQEMPGTGNFLRDVLIFSHEMVARGMHRPFDPTEIRTISVIEGFVWDYSEEKMDWLLIRPGTARLIPPGAMHGFLSPLRSMVLFQSSRPWHSPIRINMEKIYPQANEYLRSDEDHSA